MRASQLYPFLDARLEFPIDHSTVVRLVGAVEIEAPDEHESEAIATVLDRIDDGDFDSARGLTSTILSGLGPQYVGRRYYDDRGGQAPDAGRYRSEDEPPSL